MGRPYRFMKGGGEEVRITNRYITDVNNELFEIYTAFNRNGEIFSADDIKNEFIGQTLVALP